MNKGLPPHLFAVAKTVFMVCRGAGPKPLEYIGTWPKRGRIYECCLLTDFWTGEEFVTVHGLVTPQPFKRYRFDVVAEAWLN